MSYKKKQYNRPQAKPRPILEVEHDDQPIVIAAIRGKDDLRAYGTTSEISRDTFIFDTDHTRTRLPVPLAALYAHRAFGIPPNHPNMPTIVKVATMRDTVMYSPVYTEPVPWLKDSNFRHIPGYTRYVSDKFGRVLNAHNSMEIKPQWGNLKLVPDGTANRIRFISIDKIIHRTWQPLPEGMYFYNNGAESHIQTSAVIPGLCEPVNGWAKLSTLKVRDTETGDQFEVKDFHHAGLFLERKDGYFDTLRNVTEHGFPLFTTGLTMDGYQIIPIDSFRINGGTLELPPLPVAPKPDHIGSAQAATSQPASYAAPAQQQQSSSYSTPKPPVDDDFYNVQF